MQMDQGKDQHNRPVDAVEEAVWEPARDGASHLAMDDLLLERILAHSVQNGVDLFHEGTAETRALLFVPARRCPDVRLGLAPDG